MSPAARKWYRSIADEWQLDPHHEKLLELAARAWDRQDEARKILDEEGVVVRDRFGQRKPHPAVVIEKDQRILFARLVRELALDGSTPADYRPPRIAGID